MTKGQRIKGRREELQISQVQLAERANISKQTLYKYENDIISNIPSDVIEKLSNILECSPAYIMGWNDKLPFDISPLEKEIILKYRTLSEDSKNIVLRSLGIEEKRDDVIDSVG